jgi:hypothetical protein
MPESALPIIQIPKKMLSMQTSLNTLKRGTAKNPFCACGGKKVNGSRRYTTGKKGADAKLHEDEIGRKISIHSSISRRHRARCVDRERIFSRK